MGAFVGEDDVGDAVVGLLEGAVEGCFVVGADVVGSDVVGALVVGAAVVGL